MFAELRTPPIYSNSQFDPVFPIFLAICAPAANDLSLWGAISKDGLGWPA